MHSFPTDQSTTQNYEPKIPISDFLFDAPTPTACSIAHETFSPNATQKERNIVQWAITEEWQSKPVSSLCPVEPTTASSKASKKRQRCRRSVDTNSFFFQGQDILWRTRSDDGNPKVDFAVPIQEIHAVSLYQQTFGNATTNNSTSSTTANTQSIPSLSSSSSSIAVSHTASIPTLEFLSFSPPTNYSWYYPDFPICKILDASLPGPFREKHVFLAVFTIDYDDFFVVRRHRWTIGRANTVENSLVLVTDDDETNLPKEPSQSLGHVILESTFPLSVQQKRKLWCVTHVDGNVVNGVRSNLMWDTTEDHKAEDSLYALDSTRVPANAYETEREFLDEKDVLLSGGGFKTSTSSSSLDTHQATYQSTEESLLSAFSTDVFELPLYVSPFDYPPPNCFMYSPMTGAGPSQNFDHSFHVPKRKRKYKSDLRSGNELSNNSNVSSRGSKT